MVETFPTIILLRGERILCKLDSFSFVLLMELSLNEDLSRHVEMPDGTKHAFSSVGAEKLEQYLPVEEGKKIEE